MGGLPERVITFDSYANETCLHPAIAFLLLILCVWTLTADRKYSLIPILIALNFITWAQRVSVLGLDFTALRMLVCVALLRIVLRREYTWIRITRLDKTVILYTLATSIAYYLQLPNLSSIANSLGTALDMIGAYFVVRALLRDEDDLRITVVFLMWACFVITALFLLERKTAHNPFSVFGGVPVIPDIREGRMRLQGPYPHAILAGAYWAAVFPLFIGFAQEDGKRKEGMIIASFCCVAIIYLCASSTPLMSLVFAIAACVLYYQRSSLRFIKVSSFIVVVGLALAMKHPIWFLFTKIDVAGGSTGYHRYLLIDQFMQNWREWIAIGERDTFHWGQNLLMGAPGLGLADVTNQFVSEAVRGGLVSLVAFVAAFLIALDYVGTLIDAAVSDDERRQRWHIGVSVIAHLCSFLGVSYFGQLPFTIWMTLAICASLFQTHILQGKPESSFGALSGPMAVA